MILHMPADRETERGRGTIIRRQSAIISHHLSGNITLGAYVPDREEGPNYIQSIRCSDLGRYLHTYLRHTSL